MRGANMDWGELGNWVLALIAAVVGVGLVIKFVVIRKSNKSASTIIQKNNEAGGDIVGRDKISKR